jgi:magnesium chelatase family protein
VRPVKGALSMAMATAQAGVSRLIVPAACAREAAVVKEVAVYGISTLAEAVGLLNGVLPLEPVSAGIEEIYSKVNTYDVDFTDMSGQ